MKRYSILVIEHEREYELAQVDSAPEAVVDAAASQTKKIDGGKGRRKTVPRYASIRIVDNQPERVS